MRPISSTADGSVSRIAGVAAIAATSSSNCRSTRPVLVGLGTRSSVISVSVAQRALRRNEQAGRIERVVWLEELIE